MCHNAILDAMHQTFLYMVNSNRHEYKLINHSYLSDVFICVIIFIGAMYPTSMRINDEGRLVVNFKTEARFRGQFVMSHPGNVQMDTDPHIATHCPQAIL